METYEQALGYLGATSDMPDDAMTSLFTVKVCCVQHRHSSHRARTSESVDCWKKKKRKALADGIRQRREKTIPPMSLRRNAQFRLLRNTATASS